MTLWQILEAWLHDHPKHEFTAVGLAAEMNLPVDAVRDMIQSYLRQQRSKDPQCAFLLKRRGRTRGAVWSVGQRSADLRVLDRTLRDDIKTKMERAYRPDLEHLRVLNPALARKVEGQLVAVLDGALMVLSAALGVNRDDEDED